MDLETLNNVNATMAALQQLQNTVTSIADMKNSVKQNQIAQDNLDFNKIVSAQNFAMQGNQFEYQKQLNDKIMEREDNAMQRQVADLQKAGLSPLMVSNGANATPLTSASAPQRDTSGINQAIQNMTSAYNDYYTRRINRQNFALQNRVQTAQAYTQLAESKLQMEKMKIEKQILDTDLTYYRNHPERNLGIQSVLMNLAAKFLENNLSTPGVSGDIQTDIKNLVDNISNVGQSNNQSRYINYPTKKQIDKDLSILDKAQKKHVDQAFIDISIPSQFDNAARQLWDYTNASDYYKDYETFYSVLRSKRTSERFKYLKAMKIEYKPHIRLKLGK